MSFSKLEMPSSLDVRTAAAALALSATAACACAVALCVLESRRWMRIGVVDRLFVHPLKSGKLKEVTSFKCGLNGPRAAVFRDRSFCLANER